MLQHRAFCIMSSEQDLYTATRLATERPYDPDVYANASAWSAASAK
jgi:hypothetical protein